MTINRNPCKFIRGWMMNVRAFTNLITCNVNRQFCLAQGNRAMLGKRHGYNLLVTFGCITNRTKHDMNRCVNAGQGEGFIGTTYIDIKFIYKHANWLHGWLVGGGVVGWLVNDGVDHLTAFWRQLFCSNMQDSIIQ